MALPPSHRAPAPGLLRWYVAFPIALPLIALDALWVILAEKVGQGPFFTTVSLFANVFFILTALLIVNALVRRFAPHRSLSQGEMLLIYSMIGIGAALAGHDSIPGLVQMIGHPYYFDNAANGYLERFGRFLPQALMVSDKDVLRGYYEGHSTLYRLPVLQVWLRPALLWTLFISMMFWTMQCLNVLVRQGWQDRERLPFPIVEIPLQMTDPQGTLWKNGLFWAGFGIVAALEILNGLNYFYPSIPGINIKHVDISHTGIFNQRPWNAIGYTTYSFYPFVIGLGYLLPLDLLFSCWFFFFTWKAQLILSSVLALDTIPNFPFLTQQSFGGVFAILVFMFWNGRHYFREVWDRVWNMPGDISDAGEGITYRTALIGALLGLGGCVLFMVLAGMSPLVAVAAFVIYFSVSLTVTRIRAELGPPIHDLHYIGAEMMLTTSFGTPAFRPADLTMLSFFWSFDRANRSNPQPLSIEGLKVAKQIGASQRTMFWGMMLAGVFGTLCVFWAYLHLAYTYGTQAKFGNGSTFSGETFSRLNGWIRTPTPPNNGASAAIGVGFAFCFLLLLARLRFPWWPFHPIGYVISSSWQINLVWMPLLIAWIAKGVIMRYGGVRLYRQAMPFFLGLILGQMIVGSLWHLIGLALDVTPYSFWGG